MGKNEYRESLNIYAALKAKYRQLCDATPEEELLVFLMDLKKYFPLMFSIEQRQDFRDMCKFISLLINETYRVEQRRSFVNSYEVLDEKVRDDKQIFDLYTLNAFADEIDLLAGDNSVLLKRNFAARLNYPDKKIRAYVHRTGLQDINAQPIQNAKKYLEDCLDFAELEKFDYAIAVVCGNSDENSRVINFFGYSGISEWPGNPTVTAFLMKNKVIIPQKDFVCGDVILMLGQEEEFRRERKNLDDYLANWPTLRFMHEPLRTYNGVSQK